MSVSRSTTSPTRSVVLDVVTVAVIAVALGFIHFRIVGAVPPGADPGNWMALAAKLMGKSVMSADVVYPPVVPGLVALVAELTSPLTAVATVGFASRIAVGGAVFVVLRDLGRGVAAVGMVTTALFGYSSYVFAFGGYPQLLGAGAAILVVHFATRFIARPTVGRAVPVAVIALLTVLTQLLVGAIMFGVLAVVVVADWLLGPLRGRLRATFALALSLAPSLVVWLYWATSPSLSGEPTVNALDTGYRDMPRILEFIVLEQPVIWLAFLGLAVLAWILGLKGRHSPVLVQAFAWFAVGMVVWAVLLEERVLFFAQVGVVIGALALPAVLVARERSRGSIVRPATATVIVITALIAVVGMLRLEAASAHFRVVDAGTLRSLDRLVELAEPTDIALTSRGRNGFPLGWWVEGYAGIPTQTAGDLAFLTFPEERRQAEFANGVFAGRTEGEALIADLKNAGVRFVVLDRSGPDGDWATERAGLSIVVDGPRIVVFEVR